MADASINIELKGISQIRAELKALKGELANATDPTQMAELAAKAGLLSDKLKDANEKVAVFAAGSPFEQTNNALGLMGSQLASLDFEGASESAKSFAVAAKGINGEQIATQLKGLGGVVTNLGKGFMSLGATLLTNPIFLIAGVVTAIVVAIGALLNKFGLLKPILNAISSAFKFLMDVINGVVDSIKDFLDWLGLTSFAAEEAAQRQVDALEKVDKKREEQINGVTKQYDLQIRLAQIDGKNTTDMERKKQEAILATAKARYQSTLEQIEQMKLTGDADAEEIKKLVEKAKALKETAQNARNEIKIINAQEVADNRKKNEEKQKADNEAYQKAAEKRREAEKKRKEDAAKKLEDEKKEFEDRKQMMLQQAQELDELLYNANINRETRQAEQEQKRLATMEAAAAQMREQFRFQYNETLKADQTLFDARFGLAQGFIDAVGSLAGQNKKVANALFVVDKALSIAQIVVATQREIAGYASNPTWSLLPDGGAAIKASYIAAAKIRAGVSIATIAATSIGKFIGGGGGASVGGGGGAAPSASSATSNPATPSVNLFGQNNNANNLSSSTPVESTQNIVVKAVVSETEITNTQNKIKNITQASAL